MVRTWSSQARSTIAANVSTSGTTSSAGRRRAEQPGQELPEEGEAGDADGQRQQAQQHAEHDPAAQSAGHPPQFQVEVHVGSPALRCASWALLRALRKREIFNRC